MKLIYRNTNRLCNCVNVYQSFLLRQGAATTSRSRPGRPPLDPVAGPMQGEERSKYNIQKVKESRHREKISEIRKQAVSMRKDRQGGKTLRSESPQRDLDASMEEHRRH